MMIPPRVVRGACRLAVAIGSSPATLPDRGRQLTVFGRFSCARLLLGLCAIFAVPACAMGQLPATRLGGIFPGGATAGTSVDLTLSGEDLDDVDQLQFNHPGITGTRKLAEPTPFDEGPQPVERVFTVTVAADVPSGTYEIRCRGKYGISNRRLFTVGTTPEFIELEPNGGNDVPAWMEVDGVLHNAAQEVTVPVMINGQSLGGPDVDWYRLQGKAGQSLLLTALCRQIDSRMDPIITVYREDGVVVGESRLGPAGESMALVTPGSDGWLFIKVHDAIFAQGEEYTYRLLIASAPRADFVFPPAGVPGSTAQYMIYGRNLPGGQPSILTADGEPLQQLPITVTLPEDLSGPSLASAPIEAHQAGLDGIEYQIPGSLPGTGTVMITAATAPPVLESANDTAAEAQKLTVPCEVMGQFYPQRDADWYSFEAKKDELWAIDVISQRLGLRTDPSLLIQQVVPEQDGTEKVTDVLFMEDLPAVNVGNNRTGRFEFDERSGDPTVLFRVPADGVYRLLVRDGGSAGRTQAGLLYRLAIRTPRPDFRVVAVPHHSNGGFLLRRGGRDVIHLVVWRQDGFDGDIRVRVEGLPEGVTAEEAVIGPGNSFGTLVLTAGESARGAADLKILARSTIAGSEVTREARYGAAVIPTQQNQPTANVPAVRSRLVSGIRVAVSDSETAPQTLSIGDGSVLETSRGGSIKIPWQLRRSEGSAGNALGFPVDLPPNTTIPQVNLGNAEKGEFELRFTATSVPGTYTFYLAGFNQGMQYRRHPELVDRAKTRQERVAKILTEAQAAVQTLTAEQQKRQTEQTQAATAVTQATTARQQADQKLTAANTALQQAQTAARQKADQSAANPADETLKQQAAAAAVAQTEAEKAAADAQRIAEEAVKTLEAATLAKTAADEARTKAQAALTTAQQFQQRAQQEKTRSDQFLAQKTTEANARAVNVDLPSNTLTLKLVDLPITVESIPETITVNQGSKAEVAIRLVRHYGFTAPVTVTAQLPQGVAGLTIPNATIPENQQEVRYELTAQPTATVGEHLVNLRLQMALNGQTLTTDRSVRITIAAAKP